MVVAHHANEQAPVLSPAETAFLHAAAADPYRDDVAVYVVAAGRDAVETVDLEPRRPNGEIERGPRVDVLVDERIAELGRAIERAAAASTGGDLLRAMGVAGRSGAAEILVLGSGLSTTDPFDLRVAGWDRDPLALARELRDQEVLPRLDGRGLTFAGFGRTAGAQVPLGERELTRLGAMWLAICAETGATCQVDEALRPSAAPVSGLDLGVVPVQAVGTVPGPDGTREVSVPSPMLFAPDSCELVDPAAASALLEREVAGPLLNGDAAGVRISGRTAPVGTGDGIELAACRAGVSADLLRGVGVPDAAILDVRGDGALLDPPEASRDAHGRLDPTKLSALRRVVFTLVPIEEAS